jgi:hypothetical protein
MSAYMVDEVHIDALVLAGLVLQPANHGPLRWFDRDLEPVEERDAHEAGQPWGPRAVELAEQRRRELTLESAGQVGRMLLAENQRSVNHRYNEVEIEPLYDFDEVLWRYQRTAGLDLDPVKVLRAIAGYEYQACEHPQWERSEACHYLDALRRLCISQLAGYDRATSSPSSLDDIRRDSGPSREELRRQWAQTPNGQAVTRRLFGDQS